MDDSQQVNAFTVNSLAGRPFPFSAEITQNGELRSLYIFPISIHNISDIVEQFSSNFCVIFDVDHYWTKNETEPMTLSDVAAEQKMQFKSYDKEIIYCEKKEFGKLTADDFYQYNCETFDCATEPTGELIVENYIICKDHDWKSGNFLLDKLKNATFYLSSHDDCYLLLETYTKEFIEKIIQRNFKIYATTVLSEENIPVEAANFPSEILSEILSENNTFTVFRENSFIRENDLVIPYSTIYFQFLEQKEYPIAGDICFEFLKNEWRFEKQA
jgi:hypothetical protein